MLRINTEIVSFYDVPKIAEQSQKTVMLIRHSFRKSLQNGNYDAELTPEGVEYAEESGRFLKGLKDVCYGSSIRIRAVQTVKALKEGGSLEEGEIKIYPEISDNVLFESADGLENAIQSGTVSTLLQTYYLTGKADTMIDLETSHKKLMTFLTETSFEKKNVILGSHDIICAVLLMPLKVYPFNPKDWCGYVQGGLLYQSDNGDWTAAYVVPDKNKRESYSLFI